MILRLVASFVSSWLAFNAPNLGPKARQLEYVLAKLEFLIDVQRCTGNPAGVIASLPKIAPYATEFPAGKSHCVEVTPPPPTPTVLHIYRFSMYLGHL